MKKIFVLFILFFLLTTVSANAEDQRLVPSQITNYEIQETVGAKEALFPIYRKIGIEAPISNTIREILSLELTQKEKEMGFESEWTKDHRVKLIGVALEDGLLTIELSDPDRFTSGGSYRVRLLRSQIEKSVLQFKAVDQVKFIGPDNLFQP